MTDSTAQTSSADTAVSDSTASGPDRSVPQDLVDLAVLAIKRGAESVFLGHESMGFEFGAPIGWIMWIREASEDGLPKKRAHMISHQIGCDFDDFVLPEAFAGDEIEEQPVIDVLVELFEAGVKNGWGVAYERQILEHMNWMRTFEEHGLEPFGMRHELRGNAAHWGYDEAARERGDRVSTNVVFSIREREEDDPVVFSDDGGTHRKVDAQHVEALLRAPAPNTVPVAYFDDDLDEWVK